MTYPTGFSSWKNYFDYTLARKFVDADGNRIAHEANSLEKFGQMISRPVMEPISFLAKNIKNPLLILAVAVVAIAIVTIAFYPAHFILLLSNTIPFVFKIEPWMVKFATYIAVVTTISGLGVRALGRVCNQDLLRKWQNNEVHPVYLGDRRIRETINV